MRKYLIMLLMLMAAFSFSQTNATFNNLDVRGTSKLRGLIYPFGAVATSPLNPAVHEVLMLNNTNFTMCRMDFTEFADSIANVLNPIIGTHWYTVAPDTIKTLYNVVVDSSFQMKCGDSFMGYGYDWPSFPTNVSMSMDDGDTTNHVILTHGADGQWYNLTAVGNENTGIVASIAMTYYENNPTVGIKTDGNLTSSNVSLDTAGIYLSTDSLTFLNLTQKSGDHLMMWDSATNHVTAAPDSVVINGDLTVTGQIKYDFIHLVAYLSGGSYTPNTVSNVPLKMTPTFIENENDGFTFAGDSITILTAGDYAWNTYGVMQGANGSDWRVQIYVNGAPITSGYCVFSSTGAGNYINFAWLGYHTLAVGDDLSWYVTNEGANDDPTFRALKWYIEKKPE